MSSFIHSRRLSSASIGHGSPSTSSVLQSQHGAPLIPNFPLSSSPGALFSPFDSSGSSYTPTTTTMNTGSGNSQLSVLDSVFGELVSEEERDEVAHSWDSVYARDIVEDKVVIVDAGVSVEEACDRLLEEGIECLVILDFSSPSEPWIGLFDFSDVNAFLTLAATRHTLPPSTIKSNSRLDQIVEAAKAGRVPVRLVSDFSEKNPFVVLPYEASVFSVLEAFARGAHRVFIQAPTSTSSHPLLQGMISDKRLLSYIFTSSCAPSSSTGPSLSISRVTSQPLFSLAFPLLHTTSVIASSSLATVLDAMKLMSEEGVNSVAVVDEETGMVIGGVSVTDIGRVVVPSQSNQILGTPLKQFVTSIKLPSGWTDGADKYPVYSVFPSSSLGYTVEKLLATNARRLFVTDEEESVNPSMSPSSPGNLTGVISIVDVLSLFAQLARIPDVDPRRMQRHRRASSSASSSQSHRSDFLRTRSNSRAASLHRRSPSFGAVMTSSASPSPVGLRPKSPVILPTVPDIGSGALGGRRASIRIVKK